MRTLIDLCHPADVHFFRAVAARLADDGHQVVWTGRAKDVLLPLCDEFGLAVREIGGHHDSLAGKGWDLLRRSLGLRRHARRERADVLVGFCNPYVVLTGSRRRRPSLVITDSEHQGLANRLVLRATATLTPEWFGPPRGARHRQAAWFKELAYIGDPAPPDDPQPGYVLVRRVAWGATHDRRQHGLGSLDALIEALAGHRVFVAAETEPEHPLALPLPPGELHRGLAGAAVVISEGATTAAEAALLGRPTIYVNTQLPASTRQLVEAGILHVAADGAEAARLAREWLASPPAPAEGLTELRGRCIDVAGETAKLITELAR